MCQASCLGMKTLKFSETGLCECSEILWHWDKQETPPIHAASGTLPCLVPSKAFCLQSRVPASAWHPRTPAPDLAASSDTRLRSSSKTHALVSPGPWGCWTLCSTHCPPKWQLLILRTTTPFRLPRWWHQRLGPALYACSAQNGAKSPSTAWTSCSH